jgi:hypothetical protein
MNSGEIFDVKETLAKRIASIVLWGTITFGILGIFLAIVALFREGVTSSKEILQILFSTILPLLGTWIGTVLAFYFSRENLIAANQTVQHLVNKLTSDKKLEAIKAKDIMIPLASLKYKQYPTGSDDAKINLKTDFLQFIKDNKISRVILLDEENHARYVLHKSTIESFLSNQYFEKLKAAANGVSPQTIDLSFADLKKSDDQNIQAVLKNGVKFISENANLADAKLLMKSFSECNDVFITKTGSPNEPVLGWITDKTIAENSVVE